MNEDTWEERMARRAAERREAAAATRAAAVARRDREREAAVLELVGGGWDWLHGWPRIGHTGVLMGTAVHCLGCGRFHGLACVAFPDDWEPPGPEPDWPFSPDTCPICREDQHP
jgi:hypothetical protein